MARIWQGSCSIEFSHYAPVPPHTQVQLVSKHKQPVEEEQKVEQHPEQGPEAPREAAQTGCCRQTAAVAR